MDNADIMDDFTNDDSDLESLIVAEVDRELRLRVIESVDHIMAYCTDFGDIDTTWIERWYEKEYAHVSRQVAARLLPYLIDAIKREFEID